MTDPIYTQEDFQGFADDGVPGSATSKASLNNNWTQDADENFRIRFAVVESNNKAENNPLFTLEYRYDSTGTGSSWGSWTQVTTTTNEIKFSTSTHYTDGDVDNNKRVYDGAATSSGDYGELSDGATNNTIADTIDYGANEFCEMEVCLQIDSANAVDGSWIEVRVQDANLSTWDFTPQITVNIAGAEQTLTVQKAIHEQIQKELNLTSEREIETSHAYHNQIQKELQPLRNLTIDLSDAYHDQVQGDLDTVANKILDAGDYYFKTVQKNLETERTRELVAAHGYHLQINNPLPGLTSNRYLATNDSYHDTVVKPRAILVLDRSLITNDAYHDILSGIPTLSTGAGEEQILTIHPAMHQSLAAVVNLICSYSLTVFGSYLPKLLGAPSLAGQFLLNPGHIYHSMLSGVPVLSTVTGETVTVADAIHIQLSGKPTLDKTILLAVSDSITKQVAGIVTPDRQRSLEIQRAVHKLLSGSISLDTGVELLILDAIHKQLTGTPALVSGVREVLHNFIAHDIELSFGGGNIFHVYKAKEEDD